MSRAWATALRRNWEALTPTPLPLRRERGFFVAARPLPSPQPLSHCDGRGAFFAAAPMPYSAAMDGEGPISERGDRAPEFVPGLRLNERFYAETVRPILAEAFPDLRYSAALIGYGSDVLGYDTPRSTDHEWGPRLLLFVGDEAHDALTGAIETLLSQRLPPEFLGFSTHFSPPGADGSRVPRRARGGRLPTRSRCTRRGRC